MEHFIKRIVIDPSIKKYYMFNNDTGETIVLPTSKTLKYDLIEIQKEDAWHYFLIKSKLKIIELI